MEKKYIYLVGYTKSNDTYDNNISYHRAYETEDLAQSAKHHLMTKQADYLNEINQYSKMIISCYEKGDIDAMDKTWDMSYRELINDYEKKIEEIEDNLPLKNFDHEYDKIFIEKIELSYRPF